MQKSIMQLCKRYRILEQCPNSASQYYTQYVSYHCCAQQLEYRQALTLTKRRSFA